MPAASHLAADSAEEDDAALSPNPASEQPPQPTSPGEDDAARSPNPASEQPPSPTSPGEDEGWVPA